MAVEIGTLIVRGAFGQEKSDPKPALDEETLERLRRDILEEVKEILDDAERRARER